MNADLGLLVYPGILSQLCTGQRLPRERLSLPDQGLWAGDRKVQAKGTVTLSKCHVMGWVLLQHPLEVRSILRFRSERNR